jgi:hypothetical protein
MNTKKFLLGGIAGGVAFFLLGYLFYGTLFSDFFAKNAGSATGVAKQMDQFVWWSLVLGNLLYGFLLAYIFIKANIKKIGNGLITGVIIGLLFSAAYDFTSYGTSNLMTMSSLWADILILGIMSGISGAIVSWVCGTTSKE